MIDGSHAMGGSAQLPRAQAQVELQEKLSH